MARPEVLDRIKEAETEADEIIATAESDADERLAEARQRAEEIRAEAEEEADSEADDRLVAAREDRGTPRGDPNRVVPTATSSNARPATAWTRPSTTLSNGSKKR